MLLDGSVTYILNLLFLAKDTSTASGMDINVNKLESCYVPEKSEAVTNAHSDLFIPSKKRTYLWESPDSEEDFQTGKRRLKLSTVLVTVDVCHRFQCIFKFCCFEV